jgi:hypothetical protein
MKIVTSNVPKDLFKITPIAINFFVENYFEPIAQSRVEEIAVRFLSAGYGHDMDTLAYCDHDEEGRIPSSYELVFNNAYRNIKYKHYITTIFHELTHAHQYLTGHLRTVTPKKGDPYTVWKGKKYTLDFNYWFQPWEIEAYGTETCAYCHFADKFPELELKRYKSKYNGRHLAQPMEDRIKKVMLRLKS